MRSPRTSSDVSRGMSRPRRAACWLVLVVWGLLLALALPFSTKLTGAEQNGGTNYLPNSAESTRVARIVAAMPGGGTTDLELVYHRAGGLTEADRAVAGERAAAVVARYHLTRTAASRPVVSRDGSTELYRVAIPASAGDTSTVTGVVRTLLARHPEGLTVRVTGPGALGADTGKVFGSIDGMLMIATTLVVAVLLIATYRSPLLWLLPLAAVGFAAATTMALVYALVTLFGLSVSSQSAGIMMTAQVGEGALFRFAV